MDLMESNITEQQYFDGDLQLAEPHFDEEATVLSARPVVPLKEIREIKAEARSARHLVLGLSIVVSLMIGALGATLIYKQRGQKSAAAIVYAAVAGSGASTHDSAVIGSSTGEAKKDVSEADGWDASSLEDKKPAPQIARRVQSVKAGKRQEEPRYQVDEREMRRAERVEARRLRSKAEREARKKARGRKNKSSDDLLRIREIFEGPRRP